MATPIQDEFGDRTLETANAAVLFCRDVLEKRDLGHLTFNLQGLEPIDSREVGQVVLGILMDVQANTQKCTPDVREAVSLAVATLGRAVISTPAAA